MSVAELLHNLKELQLVDKEIYDSKKALVEVPVKLKVLDDELEAANLNVKQKEEKLKNLQLERKTKEGDLEQKEGAIRKLQVQLYQVKTNKEYTTLEKEIAGLKADKSLLEEEILGIFDKIELAENVLNDARAKLNEERKRIDMEKKKINAEKQEIEKNLAGLEEKRNSITPLIDKETLSRYERILYNKDGLALVPIKGENCGGCYMNLPPQIINEVRLKEKIMYCERCARMLFADEY
jgi:hypothetical protein